MSSYFSSPSGQSPLKLVSAQHAREQIWPVEIATVLNQLKFAEPGDPAEQGDADASCSLSSRSQCGSATPTSTDATWESRKVCMVRCIDVCDVTLNRTYWKNEASGADDVLAPPYVRGMEHLVVIGRVYNADAYADQCKLDGSASLLFCVVPCPLKQMHTGYVKEGVCVICSGEIQKDCMVQVVGYPTIRWVSSSAASSESAGPCERQKQVFLSCTSFQVLKVSVALHRAYHKTQCAAYKSGLLMAPAGTYGGSMYDGDSTFAASSSSARAAASSSSSSAAAAADIAPGNMKQRLMIPSHYMPELAQSNSLARQIMYFIETQDSPNRATGVRLSSVQAYLSSVPPETVATHVEDLCGEGHLFATMDGEVTTGYRATTI